MTTDALGDERPVCPPLIPINLLFLFTFRVGGRVYIMIGASASIIAMLVMVLARMP